MIADAAFDAAYFEDGAGMEVVADFGAVGVLAFFEAGGGGCAFGFGAVLAGE